MQLLSAKPLLVHKLFAPYDCARPIRRQAICGYNHRMLSRYKIYRGKRPNHDSLPDGIRQDTRKHTRHCLRPSKESVAEYLADPRLTTWKKFATQYGRDLEERFEQDPKPFDRLAELATENGVSIGCSCPTTKNPDVNHCHTVIALQFMKKRYAKLDVLSYFPHKVMLTPACLLVRSHDLRLDAGQTGRRLAFVGVNEPNRSAGVAFDNRGCGGQ